MADDSKDRVSRIKEWKRKSQDFYASLFDEFVEVQQASKCRTSPIMVKDKNGKLVEDKTRTNVCMPMISIMYRKNKARMTAQPPKIGFVSNTGDDTLADRLTAWSYWQFDMTNESETQRKHVGQAELFGLSVTKLYQDDVNLRRVFRLKTKDATRSQLMSYGGAPEADVQQAVATQGDQLMPEEVANAIAQHGDEITREVLLKKYSGPCVKFIFIGDLYFPPACESLESADWIIEEYVETERFLEYWVGKTYTDPDTKEEVPVFDAKAVQEMVDEDKEIPQNEKDSLRQRFRELVKQDKTEPTGKRLYCGKKFKILECHEKREDGRTWITWVGNDQYLLGEMPYPWDLYGKYCYTALAPLPDSISVFGDSTPRLARYLHRMHNASVGQRTDLINQVLRPLALTTQTADIDDDATERSLFRELRVKKMGDVQIERLPNVPPEAWENESAILRVMAALEPSLNSADFAGTNEQPQTGRTATVGVLAQRERDTLLADKIAELNNYFKELYQKKLWMLQQTMQDKIELPQQYLSDSMLEKILGKQEGVSMRTGKAEVITLDWTEIQEDIQVEPEAGSTLSIDDEFHRMAAQQLYQAAAADPETFDKYYAAEQWASRIKGVDASKAVKAPTNPPPVPPKVSVSISVPFEKLPAEVQNQMLQEIGLQPSPELVHEGTLKGVKLLGEAADGAAKLEEPAGVGAGTESGPEGKARKTLAG